MNKEKKWTNEFIRGDVVNALRSVTYWAAMALTRVADVHCHECGLVTPDPKGWEEAETFLAAALTNVRTIRARFPVETTVSEPSSDIFDLSAQAAKGDEEAKEHRG